MSAYPHPVESLTRPLMMSVEIEQLQYQAGGHAILSDVSLRARQGEHVAILGANGSGKSTLLRLIAGLAVPASGQIRIHDQVCSDAGRCVVPPARRDVAMMFQDHGLWPHLTVRQNVELGSRYKHASRVEWRGAVDAAIEQCDLSMLCHRKARDLSGGEQQRVAMARALATQARILLLDEPLSALDAIQSLAVARLVRAVASSGRTTILSIAHRPDDVWALAPGRIVVLEDGRLIEEPALARPESSASRESGLPRSAFLKQWLAAKEAGADQQACHGASCPISTDP